MLDLHVHSALDRGWPLYVGSTTLARFKSLFLAVPDATLEKWWTALRAKLPHFHLATARAPEDRTWPIVNVQLSSETVIEQALGDFAYRTDAGDEVSGFIVDQVVSIEILEDTPELCRAMHTVLRACIVNARKPFLEAGYLDFRYVGADELSESERLAAESMGIYVRRLRVMGRSQIDVPLAVPAAESKRWQVALFDITDSEGRPGGVYPDDG